MTRAGVVSTIIAKKSERFFVRRLRRRERNKSLIIIGCAAGVVGRLLRLAVALPARDSERHGGHGSGGGGQREVVLGARPRQAVRRRHGRRVAEVAVNVPRGRSPPVAQVVARAELLRAPDAGVAPDRGQSAHDRVHRLAVALQVFAIRYYRRVLANFVKSAKQKVT